jgi:hypothetical protein
MFSPLYFGAVWLPTVTGVYFFLVSETGANLITKSGELLQFTVISCPALTTGSAQDTEWKESARLFTYPAYIRVK